MDICMSVIRKINGEWKTIQISRKFKQLLVQKNWESTVNKRPTEGTKQFYKVVNMFVHSYIAQNIDKVLYISSQMLNIYVVLWIFFFTYIYHVLCIHLRTMANHFITPSFGFLLFANPIGKHTDHQSVYTKTVATLKIEELIRGHVVLVLFW